MRKSIKERLAGDISHWLTEGWIDRTSYDVLIQRYEVSNFSLDRILKYLGIIGGIIILLGVLGLISAVSESLFLSIFMLLFLAAGSFIQGMTLYRDKKNRYPFSARTLLLVGMIFYGGALGLFANLLEMSESSTLLFIGIFWLVPTLFAAYYFTSNFILVLAVLSAFHWIGSWHRMLGRSTYAFSIQDPRAMIVFSLVICIIGIIHDLYMQEKYRPFYKVYVSISLLYCNMSVLILSIFDELKLFYAITGIIFSMAQVLAGARLHRNIFTGYGVTFTGIHIFTRYHEIFWDKLELGLFFLLGGAILLGAGVFFEWYMKSKEGPE